MDASLRRRQELNTLRKNRIHKMKEESRLVEELKSLLDKANDDQDKTMRVLYCVYQFMLTCVCVHVFMFLCMVVFLEY